MCIPNQDINNEELNFYKMQSSQNLRFLHTPYFLCRTQWTSKVIEFKTVITLLLQIDRNQRS